MRDFIARQNSERLRQRLSAGIRVREPAAFARLARSLVEIAIVTGIVARVYRMVVLSRAERPASIAVSLTVGALFLLLMTAAHMSRFPIRQWFWRGPAFAAVEAASEMITSLVLIAAGREPLGTGAATFRDWPGMAVSTMAWRIATISVFTVLLAGVVKWVRYMILRREHAAWSEGTVKVGIPGEDFIERRASRSGASDPLLFGERRHHDKKRGT